MERESREKVRRRQEEEANQSRDQADDLRWQRQQQEEERTQHTLPPHGENAMTRVKLEKQAWDFAQRNPPCAKCCRLPYISA
jgi:hypothetical protein